ncbi:unnamed protein product [Rotaria magnacalcarata]|uniref:Uncharacterized protein n=1 Tax=Rotaria magnacalcarata TaxID=392030 RepID=A0A816QLA1_9BILA|nr:unnamed protein product [Rotaria magnacalcarata]CAF2063182.1 unnamed protein product [Rotaria magnacalcarata]CAF3747967.1 unnamed protein product [Rotaria magnacalcarata]CAF3759214.1 unnamed protein product [Rotaria magnacalcarata]
MDSNQLDLHSAPIYQLFFDDIEEIFLNTISFRFLCIVSLITCILIIGILILIFCRTKQVFLACLIPFIYALVFYDFIQLLSLILLKRNATAQFLNQLCRWPYYLKSLSDAGQCLTIIFIFSLSRHQIRYFITHNHLPNSSYIHSRTLAFACLLFILYVNNWITHLKVEKVHLVTLNKTKHEINVQELPISLYAITQIQVRSHQRFLTDLDRYSQGTEKNMLTQNQQKVSNDKIIHNHNDGSIHEIIIKFPYDYLFHPVINRTRRTPETIQANHIFNSKSDENEYNSSYRVSRCTYGQSNFFLTNLLGLVNSIGYFILILYYLTIIYTYKITDTAINYRKQFYEKSFSFARKNVVGRHKHFILLLHLKQFLCLIICSHTLITFIRLVYVCLLTIMLCFYQTPFRWQPIKIFFYSLFLICYFSIPIRMILLFIYCFINLFSTQLRSVIFYLFNTNLRFSWKLEKPTICFRLQLVPYPDNCKDQRIDQSVVVDLSSSCIDDQSNALPQESMIMPNESSNSQNGVTTAILTAPTAIFDESTPHPSAIAKL